MAYRAWVHEAAGRETTLRRNQARAWRGAPTFGEWCEQLSRSEGLPAPSSAAAAAWEELGWSLLTRAAAFERVRDPFRRALETWLLLDRALSLVEAGLHVEIGEFCAVETSPRNVAILAHWT